MAPVGVPELVAWIVGAYAVFVAVVGGLAVRRKEPRSRALDQFAWMLTGMSILLAFLSGTEVGVHNTATHVGYLGAAVVVMPFAIASVRHDRGAWTSGVLAVAALATAVVAWRVIVTGHVG
jgi:hypothetical protein